MLGKRYFDSNSPFKIFVYDVTFASTGKLSPVRPKIHLIINKFLLTCPRRRVYTNKRLSNHVYRGK